MSKRSISIITLLILFVTINACKKEVDDEQLRLFRPVIKGSLQSDGNYIKASWEKIKGAVTYTIQISRDTFRTIDQSLLIDSAVTTFEGLKWDQKYQLQVRANAPDSLKNSKMSYLGEIKTPKFPTILNTPSLADINASQVRVSWVTGGAVVTSVRILKASDSSVVKNVTLTATDVTSQFKLVDGLASGTAYIIFLYSGTSVRGWANFSTSEPLQGIIIDLTQITGRPSVLADTLPMIQSGSTVLLKKGEIYNISSAISLSKSVTITSGDDLVITQAPVVYFTSNFTFAASSTIDYIRFTKVELKSDNYGSRYVFNVNSACNVGEISFSSCKLHAFRGVARFQNQDITVGNYTLNDCQADSIKDYGILSVDGANSLVQNITIINSTVYKSERVIVCTKPIRTMNLLTVENCTFNECPLGGTGTDGIGNALIDCSNMKFTTGLTFKTSIIGIGWKRDNVLVRGVRPGLGSLDGAGNYITSDAKISSDAIPNTTVYPKLTSDLFTDPDKGNFKIKDNSFAGKSSAGDPRWR